MKLIYIGPDPATVGVVPLPEGWPAESHEETEETVAAAKLASGMYQQDRPPRTKALPAGVEE